jgi:hypothetical protein
MNLFFRIKNKNLEKGKNILQQRIKIMRSLL